VRPASLFSVILGARFAPFKRAFWPNAARMLDRSELEDGTLLYHAAISIGSRWISSSRFMLIIGQLAK